MNSTGEVTPTLGFKVLQARLFSGRVKGKSCVMKTRNPIAEPTIEQCKAYLEAHVRPAKWGFVCWHNLAYDMQCEAWTWGVNFKKSAVRARMKDAALALRYTLNGIDLEKAEYLPKEGNV